MNTRFSLCSLFAVAVAAMSATSVFALSGSGTGGPFTVITQSQFPAPQNVHATSRSGGDMAQGGVSITWESVHNAPCYGVFFSQTAGLASTETSGRTRLAIVVQGNWHFDAAAYRGERSRAGWYAVCVCDESGKPLSPFSSSAWGDWYADDFKPPHVTKVVVSSHQGVVVTREKATIRVSMSHYDQQAFPDVKVRLRAIHFSTGTGRYVNDIVSKTASVPSSGATVEIPMQFPVNTHGDYVLQCETFTPKLLGFSETPISRYLVPFRVFFSRGGNDGIDYRGSGKNVPNWFRYWRYEADRAICTADARYPLKYGKERMDSGAICVNDDSIYPMFFGTKTLTNRKTGQVIRLTAPEIGLESVVHAIVMQMVRNTHCYPDVVERNGKFYKAGTNGRPLDDMELPNADGDTLSDDTERHGCWDYALQPDMIDTYGMAQLNRNFGWNGYADQELMVWDMSKIFQHDICKEKDWAYPGSQSKAGSIYEDDSKTEYEPLASTLRSASAIANIGTIRLDSPSTARNCDSLPAEFDEEVFSTSWGNIVAVQVVEPETDLETGKTTAIRVSVELDVRKALEAEVTVYLADNAGNPLCMASVNSELEVGNSQAVVSFPADVLSNTGAGSFRVAFVTLSHGGIPFSAICASSKPDIALGTAESLGLAEPALRILGVTGVRQTEEGLVVAVSIKAAETGIYNLSASLYAEETGSYLATTSADGLSLVCGENRAELLFCGTGLSDVTDLLPWRIDALELRRDGEIVATWNGSFTIGSEDFNINALSPSGRFLDVSEAVVEWLAPSTTEGGNHALKLFISAPFNVPQPLPCRFSASLVGTNGVTACEAQTMQICTNGINQSVLLFPIADIGESEAGGPYVVHVAFVDALDGSGRSVAIPFGRKAPWSSSFDAIMTEPSFSFADNALVFDLADNALKISIPILARRAGSASVKARLYSSDGIFVVGAETEISASSAGNMVAVLRFPYSDIRMSDVRGPFFIDGISIAPSGDGLREIEYAGAPIPVEPFAPLPPVTGLRAEFSEASASCLLRWWADNDAEGYRIYRSDSDDFSSAVLVGTTDGISFRDDSPPAGSTLRYWVAPLWNGAEGPVEEAAVVAIPARDSATIVFDMQGGTGGTASVTTTRGAALPSITVPSRTGYQFEGYFFDTNGHGTQYYSKTGVGLRNWDYVGRATIFAKWTKQASASTASTYGTETVNGITWNYRITNGEASVGGGTETTPAIPTSTTGHVEVPSRLGGCPVTSIGNNAFSNCRSLSSVSIPEGVATIGREAFHPGYCLTDVSLPSTLTNISYYAFGYCKLSNVVLPSSLVSIGAYAFCDNLLTNLVIPAAVSFIGQGAFCHNSMTSISVECGNQSFVAEDGILFTADLRELVAYPGARQGAYEIPENVRRIWPYAFTGVGLTEVFVPDTVEELGSEAFRNCENLISARLPDHLDRIPFGLFMYCHKLSSLVIPDGVESIGSHAFEGCSFQDIVIPESVTSLEGAYTFLSCRSLTSLVIPLNVRRISSSAFMGCSSLTSLHLPKRFEGETEGMAIPSNCTVYFYGTTSLSIDCSPSVTGGDAISLSCKATTDYGTTVSVTPDWSIASGASFGSITSKGVFTANATETARTVTVKATLDNVSATRQISILPSSISLATALDNTGLIFSTGGDAPWTGQTLQTYDGEDAARSGTVSHNQSSWLQTAVTGPGLVSFWWKASSESVRYDWLEFIVDDIQNGKIGGMSASWTCRTVSIGPGSHTLRWNYCKDNIVSDGEDCGWVDQIVWRPIRNIALDRQGGKGGTVSVTATNGAALPPISVPVRAGYAFGGYWTGKNGTGTQYYSASGASARNWDRTSNTTLYANWIEVGFTETVGGLVWTYTVKEGEAWVGDGHFKGKPAVPTNTVGVIAIPERLGGFPVVGINDYGFYGCASLTGITVHDGVKNVGREAFNGCTSLLDLDLPDGNTSLMFWAMNGCTSLTNAVIPNGVRFLTGTFCDCENLEAIALPETLQGIYQQAFDSCQRFTSFEIPDGVVELGNSLFNNCTNLVEIRIPASVASIPEAGTTFGNCPMLERIIVDGANPWFRSIGGILYDADGKTLIKVPDSRSGAFAVAGTVTTIGSNAFGHCWKITSLELPDGLTAIGRRAFSGCAGLETLFVPGSVTNIVDQAFDGCWRLDTLYLPKRFEESASSFGISSGCSVVFYDASDEPVVLTLDRQQGFGGSSSTKALFGHALPSIMVPSRQGHLFAGYWTEPDGGGLQYYNANGMPLRTCDLAVPSTLYAAWTELRQTVMLTLDKNGGDGGSDNVQASFGMALPNIAAPSKQGFVFGGYWTDANGGGFQYYDASGNGVCLCGASANSILYAKWTRASFTVALDRQGGTGGTSSVMVSYGATMPAISLPYRDNKIFKGYWSAPNGGGTQYYAASGASVRNWDRTSATTLYANWIEDGNHAPVIDSLSPEEDFLAMEIGSSQKFAVSAHDPDGDAITTEWYWRLPDDEEWTPCGYGTEFLFTPDEPGSNFVAACVTDGRRVMTKEWVVDVLMGEVRAFGIIDGSDLIWTIKGSTLTISGIGEMPNGFMNDSDLLAYVNDITAVIVNEYVTAVDSQLWEIFPNLTTIVLPTTLEVASHNEFSRCTNLEMLYLPQQFFDCIDDLGIPDTCSVASTDVYYFVKRLYNLCFNREHEWSGCASWSKKLTSGANNGAMTAYGFFMSAEMTRRNLSNADYVEVLYMALMDRASDTNGKRYWVDLLDSGVSRKGVFRGFAESKEFTRVCDDHGIVRGSVDRSRLEQRDINYGVTKFVARCYTKALNRKYEVSGLNSWCGKINSSSTKKATAIQVAKSFLNSKEFKNRNLSNSAYVDVLYQTFFDRNPDTNGKKKWLGQLNSGVSRDKVMASFYNSKEFSEIMAGYGIR